MVMAARKISGIEEADTPEPPDLSTQLCYYALVLVASAPKTRALIDPPSYCLAAEQ